MTEGILQRLPDLGPFQAIADASAGSEDSPITAVIGLVNTVQDLVQEPFELTELTTLLQSLIQIVQSLNTQLDLTPEVNPPDNTTSDTPETPIFSSEDIPEETPEDAAEPLAEDTIELIEDTRESPVETSSELSTTESVEDAIANAVDTSANATDPTNLQALLTPVVEGLERLGQPLGIDVSGLVTQFPAALNALQSLTPEDILAQVERIQSLYTQILDFIQNSALAQAGSFSQDAALQTIKQAFAQFHVPMMNPLGDTLNLLQTPLNNLSESLDINDDLQIIQTVLEQVTTLPSNLSTDPSELLTFMTQQLIAVVSPDQVRTLLADWNNTLAAPQPDLLNMPILRVQDAIATQFETLNVPIATLKTAVENCDVTNPADYERLRSQLETVQMALYASVQNRTLNRVNQLYSEIEALLASPAVADILSKLDRIFVEYPNRLSLLFVEDSVSGLANQLIDGMNGLLTTLLSGVSRAFEGAGSVLSQLQSLSGTIRSAFENSGILTLYQALQGFLEQIQQVSETVSLSALQALIRGLFDQIQTELNALGIDDITGAIAAGFTSLETFLTETLSEDNMVQPIRQLLSLMGQSIQRLTQPLEELTTQLEGALAQLNQLFATIETEFQGAIDTLTGFVMRLEELNFQPVGDLTVMEIDRIRTRLQSINPTTLSEPERLAIQGAASVLKEIKKDTVVNLIKDGFGQAQDQVRIGLNQLTAILEQVQQQLEAYSPAVLLRPVQDILDRIMGFVDQMNSEFILSPVRDQVNRLVTEMSAIAPGQLLEPLQSPYDTVLNAINRLNPSQWLAPVVDLYGQINPAPLLKAINVQQLLDQLQGRQQQLFSNIQTVLINSLNNLKISSEFSDLFAPLRSVLDSLIGAVFGNGTVGGELNLAELLNPLDQVFDDRVTQFNTILSDRFDDVLAAIEPIHQAFLSVGLDRLSPQALLRRFGFDQASLETFAPITLMAAPLQGVSSQVTALQATFAAKANQVPAEQTENYTAIATQIENLLNSLNPDSFTDLLSPLQQAYDGILNFFGERFNVATVEAAYTRLVRSLPDFLLQPTPLTELTAETILNHINALRPSALVSVSLSQPVQVPTLTLGPTVNRFFSDLRAIALQIDPRPLLQIVQTVYASFDPAQLITVLEDVFNQITAPLAAINPSVIQGQLNQLFETVIALLSERVGMTVDAIAKALDEQLSIIRTFVSTPIPLVQTVINNTTETLQEILNQFANFLFVELIERLNRVVDNLGISFSEEIKRVVKAFNQMITAIPV